MKPLAHGVFNWDRIERTSKRYGGFYLGDTPYSEGPPVACAKPWQDLPALTALGGKKVRVRCQVIAVRDSEHVGDVFLKIKPSRPELNEIIDLGVGVLELSTSADGNVLFVVQPGDGRSKFWCDPRSLYRLHSQTVDLFVEETSDDFSLAPEIEVLPDGVIAVEGGAFQSSGVNDQDALERVRSRSLVSKPVPGVPHTFEIVPQRFNKGDRIT